MLFNKPTYIGFTGLGVIKLFIYENYYDILEICCGGKNLKFHLTDTSSSIDIFVPVIGSTTGELEESRKNMILMILQIQILLKNQNLNRKRKAWES